VSGWLFKKKSITMHGNRNVKPVRNVLFPSLHKCAAVRDALIKCQTNFILYFIIDLANLPFLMCPCTYNNKILVYGN